MDVLESTLHNPTQVLHNTKRMATLSFQQVQQELYTRVSQKVVSEIITYIKAQKPSLWGEQQPRPFLSHTVTLVLYKDAFKIGYQRLLKRVKLSYKITHKSLQHNAEVLRRIMKEWAQQHIILGSETDWNQAVRHCDLKGDVKDANLWMDSTDVPEEGKRSVSRKDPRWSFKLNGPGRRYMIVRDGKGKIRKIWGGYSPKVHDGTWLELMKESLEESLSGAVVLADNHFSAGKKLFESVTFLTNYAEKKVSKKRKRESEEDGEGLTTLTKQQKQFNSAHRKARARIETPFGYIKSKFESLEKPWSEKEEQLDCLVWTAVGIYNKSVA
jgi:hypothetical protein